MEYTTQGTPFETIKIERYTLYGLQEAIGGLPQCPICEVHFEASVFEDSEFHKCNIADVSYQEPEPDASEVILPCCKHPDWIACDCECHKELCEWCGKNKDTTPYYSTILNKYITPSLCKNCEDDYAITTCHHCGKLMERQHLDDATCELCR
jgi:hypothetical protein